MAYSHSQIQLYKQCPRRYRYEKVDKFPIPADEQKVNLYFPLGTAVHYALEMLYKGLRQKYIPRLDIIHRHFKECREKEMKEILKKTGKDSIFDCFQKEALEQTTQRGLHYIQRYYNHYHPFDGTICDGTEVTLWFEIQPNTKFQAKMDRFDIRDDTAYIVDYKTTRSLPKEDEDTIKQQLSLYALAVQQNYGDKIKHIYGTVIYLHLEKEYSREVSQSLLDDIRQEYLKIIESIEHDKFAYNFGNSEAFIPLEGRHCSQCPFQRICPVWKHLRDGDEEITAGELWTTTIRQMVDKVYELGQESKNIEQQKSFYLELLKQYAVAKWYTKKLYGHESKLRIDQKMQRTILVGKKEELSSKLQEQGMREQVVKEDIDKIKLDTLLESWVIPWNSLLWLVQKEEKITIGWPTKLKEGEESL